MTRPHRPRRVPAIAAVLLATLPAALLPSACSSVRVQGDPDLVLHEGDGYAWSGTMPDPQPEGDGGGNGDGVPWRAFVDAVDAELAGRGLRSVDPAEADWRVEIDLRVALAMRENNPYFNPYVGERFEKGTLVLTVADAATGEVRWSAETERPLRDTERTMGGPTGAVWTPVDAERDWDVEDMAARVVRRLPVSRGGS